jgi:hypothetical protein
MALLGGHGWADIISSGAEDKGAFLLIAIIDSTTLIGTYYIYY